MAQEPAPTVLAPEAELRSWYPASVQVASATASLDVGSAQLNVTFDDAAWTLTIEPHSVRASEFQLLVQNADGELVEEAAAAPGTFRGRVEGHGNSRVAVTERDGQYRATIYLGPGEWWFLEPLEGSATATGEPQYAAYQRSDILEDDSECGGAEPGDPDAELLLREPLAIATGGLRVADLAIDTDVEYFQANGSSASATLDDVENLVNGLSLLYEVEAGIAYELTTVIVRTQEADPYSSTAPSTLLQQFRTTWNGSMAGVHRDIAHLLTGKNLDGSVIGIAYLDTMCQVCGSAAGYGLSQSRFSSLLGRRICLTAHELGHNWGAPHCDGEADCGLMCSTLGGCSGVCDEFGTTTTAIVSASAASASCLGALAPPASLPFCENFDGGLSSQAWSYLSGADVVASNVATPSPPSVLRLDRCCTSCAAAPDEIRSNTVPLGGVLEVTITFWTRHVGTGSSSRLVSEYQDSSGGWVPLDRITPQDAPGIFARWVYAAPADALHDGFRLRFRLDPASDGEEWNIDNVSIDAGGECGRIITLEDFAAWGTCATGPDGVSTDPACTILDANGDDRLDLLDIRSLQNGWSGL